MTKKIFITGMFRSGTTLVGKIFNAHPEISFATDFMQPLFKQYRNYRAKKLNIYIEYDAELSDYYFDYINQELFIDIQEHLDFNETIIDDDVKRLQKSLYDYAFQYGKNLATLFGKVEGKTYSSIIEELLKIVNDDNNDVVAFKSVFTDEFIPIFMRTYPNAFVVQVLRDPRAVCVSRNQKTNKNDWIYLSRQWRKSAALAQHYKKSPKMKDRYQLIYYEDLINHPEETINRLCENMGLDMDDKMLDPEKFVDSDREQWAQNSNYDNNNNNKSFDKEAIYRWKDKISYKEKMLIEYLCGPEMLLHNYIKKPVEENIKLSINPPRYELSQLSSWEQKFRKVDDLSLAVEMHKEYLRGNLLRIDKHHSLDLIRGCFLMEDVYLELSKKYYN